MRFCRYFAVVALWLVVAPGVVSAQEDYVVLKSFEDSHPATEGAPLTALVKGSDGNLYGGGIGGMYRIRPDGSFTRINDLEITRDPIQARDGFLYGSTNDQIFRIALSGEHTLLATFQAIPDGTLFSPLVEGADGNLYGTAKYPGSGSPGRIFRMEPSGAVTTVHEFAIADGDALLTRLYSGTDGNLYGSTAWGGDGFGTIFKLAMDGGVTTIHEFTGGPGLSSPEALVQRRDGALFGVAAVGGLGWGGVFKVGPAGEAFTVLRMFSGGVQEAGGVATLFEGGDGVVYGATIATIFSISGSDEYRLLHSNGNPYGGGNVLGNDRWGAYLTRPVEWHDGNLYGAALDGGPAGNGVIFRLNRRRSACANVVELMVQGDDTYTALYLTQVLKSEEPAYIGAWFVSHYGVQQMWSGFVPALTPAAVFQLINGDTPNIGYVGVFSLVVTADFRVCSAWETIDTGGTGLSATEALSTLSNHLSKGAGK